MRIVKKYQITHPSYHFGSREIINPLGLLSSPSWKKEENLESIKLKDKFYIENSITFAIRGNYICIKLYL